MIAASKKGVKVRIITDTDMIHSPGSDIVSLKKAGIPIKSDDKKKRFEGHGHMHNKFAILDGQTVINGSFNWTRSAVISNSENVVITKGNSSLSSSFTGEFERLWREYKYF